MMGRRAVLTLSLAALLLAACGAGGARLPSTLAPGQLPAMPGAATAAPGEAQPGDDGARLAVPGAPPGSSEAGDSALESIGPSLEGRPIAVWRFGEGPRRVVLVGGIHGGFEANSALLAEMLVDHFYAHPEDVLPGIQLVLIPVANPDGLVRGRGVEARFNAAGVDLNRNWGCEWSETAILQDMPIDPGAGPFSEPESRALRDFFIAEQPDAVVFYHSAAGGVFTGACGDDHPPAHWLGELLEEATGYPYGVFDHYEVTGDATNWLAEQGIPAAIVELNTQTEPEFEQNLPGVHALQCRLTTAGGSDPAVQRLCPSS